MITMQPFVVGIFLDRTQAERAVNELHQAGFDNRHIRFAAPGASTGRVLEKIKSLFTGQDIPVDGIYDALVNRGMSPEDARYYQSEIEAGRSIVAVLRTGAPLVATSILARNSGYSADLRFAQFQDTSIQRPPIEDVNAKLNGANERIAPSSGSARTPAYRSLLPIKA